MRILHGSTYALATNPLNAEAIAFGNVIPLGGLAFLVSTEIINGSENLTIVGNDDSDEKILKGARTTDTLAGNFVVGAAPINVIESEFEDYIIYPTIVSGSNVLYKGRLKVSRTEAYTPSFLSTPNVQFKTA